MENTEAMIEKLFLRMDVWRHLPSYQLERRADLFFSLYISEVISKRFSCKVKEELIPEFPVKLSIIYNNRKENDESFIAENYNLNSNQSVKIDYVTITENYEKAFLIELKTDKNSVKQNQIENLIYSGNKFSDLIRGVQEIYYNSASNSIYRNKYHCLLNMLDGMGLFGETGVFKEAFRGKGSYADLRNRVNGFELIPNIKEMTKVYIAPSKTDCSLLKENNIEVITFKEFIEIANNSNNIDYLSSRFFHYLSKWDTTDAGERNII